MNEKIKNIKDFILSQSDYFADGLDISSVRRKYRREEGLSISREDTSDALILMRKDGILCNNWNKQIMEFCDES